MTPALRRLKPSGLELFGQYLDGLKKGGVAPPPFWLLTDATHTEAIEPEIPVPDATFANRLQAATYLDDLFAKAELAAPDRDVGLWAWLSLRFFDQLCPAGKGGHRDPGEFSGGTYVRHVPEVGNYLKYYRHLLAGPYLVFRQHKGDVAKAMVMLQGAIDAHGEFMAQIASRLFVSIKSVVGAATLLYMDGGTGEPKWGARGSGKGSPRRFAAVLNQFSLTWDLYEMSPEQIVKVLPAEFDRFRLPGPPKKVKRKTG